MGLYSRSCTLFQCILLIPTHFPSLPPPLIGRKLHPSKLRDVLIDLQVELGYRTILKKHNVARNTVKSISLSMDLYDTPYPPESIVKGRPKLLLRAQEKVTSAICIGAVH